MTYAEAIGYLNGLRMFGANFGLETTRALAAVAGNPHERLRFIHVAGTNGKGSTCAMLESIYRASGLRVGLFTSPHLISFRERIQVNREWISEADVARLVEQMQPTAVAAVPPAGLRPTTEGTGERNPAGGTAATGEGKLPPTFFEFVTVLALRYFAEQQCDLVIWETGLGGRLDATNIVTPLASVITSISFDHQQWLGDTLAQIAAEKAGILKPGVPAVTAVDDPEARAVIRSIAQLQRAPLTVVERQETALLDGSFVFPLLGEHQRQNAALAQAVVRVLQEKIPVREAAIRDGLAHVQWPGRLQVVERGAQTLLLDGAHNPEAAIALRTALQPHFSKGRLGLVLGILQDKDWRKVCAILAPLAQKIFLVPVSSERTCAPDELKAACTLTNPGAAVVVCGSLSAALAEAADEPFVVITGSLYLVGEALELLNPSGTGPSGERGLNEWSSTTAALKSRAAASQNDWGAAP
jgi:dihydrofolate synthase/folylpolyglutamate synthase